MTLEILSIEDYNLSTIFIFDFRNYTLGHVPKITLSLSKKCETCTIVSTDGVSSGQLTLVSKFTSLHPEIRCMSLVLIKKNIPRYPQRWLIRLQAFLHTPASTQNQRQDSALFCIFNYSLFLIVNFLSLPILILFRPTLVMLCQEASRCAQKRNIILNSARSHNHFITQGNYKATCFDYKLVIFRPIFVNCFTRCYAPFGIPSCLHPWNISN